MVLSILLVNPELTNVMAGFGTLLCTAAEANFSANLLLDNSVHDVLASSLVGKKLTQVYSLNKFERLDK